MTISSGDKLPEAKLLRMGGDGPQEISLNDYLSGKKTLIFAVPGAFTPTCTNSHLPGYVENASKFYEKGVDHILCVSVNDPFVLNAWGEMIGAQDQRIEVLGDPSGEFVDALGLQFDAPPAGLYKRSKRFALIADDGVVSALEVEESPGVCELSSAGTMLGKL